MESIVNSYQLGGVDRKVVSDIANIISVFKSDDKRSSF